MRRLALAVAVAVAAACGDEPGADCPGEPVGTFLFTGRKVAAGDPSIAALDPVPATTTPDCPDAWYPQNPQTLERELPPFQGTLSADPASSAAALCRSRGPSLFGPRTGDHYVLETRTDGAVLGEQCAPTCSAGLRLVVEGDVVRDGETVSFTGVLVEVMSAAAGSACGTCSLPCAARYALEGAP